MKDLKSYIESGVLELYALGDLSAAERHEVEVNLQKYPELKAELHEIEKSLEDYAAEHAIEPHTDIRESVLASLPVNDVDSENIRPLQRGSAGGNFYKYGFAASVALLMLSIAALINLNSRLKDSNQRIAVLEDSNRKFSSNVKYINTELAETKQSLDFYKNIRNYRMVELKGLSKAPEAKMTVAFNPGSHSVMIDMASLEMPENNKDHQYQLWAIVDGKPVDLGVFDKKEDTSGMLRMKTIESAEAFAVTLERRGGNATPTMSQMMVMGRI